MKPPVVVNITDPDLPRDWHRRPETYVYIGRKSGSLPESLFANPYPVAEHGRDRAIAMYRGYVLASPHIMRAIPKLTGKILVCFCKPRACHGDVLVDLWNKRTNHGMGDFPDRMKRALEDLERRLIEGCVDQHREEH